ncbi:MAG: hypothetical protein M3Y13_00565 [Armatimonadota bacterium]|nr:hypothetical protein [Armatimonadota bacterium]
MQRTTWAINRWTVLLLLLAYIGLFLEIRYDHNHVLMHKNIAWTPIIYSAVMVVVGAISLAFWESWGRTVMLWLFGAGVIVGLLGFWLHNMGHPFDGIGTMLSAWAGQHPDPTSRPPVLAPLAFAGLGALGWALCLPRFQQAASRSEQH